MTNQVVISRTPSDTVILVNPRHIIEIAQKHLLTSCIELIAATQQELLWETVRTTYDDHPSLIRAWSLVCELAEYKRYAERVITGLVGHIHEGNFPELHPAVKLSRDKSHDLIIEFKQDLRDFVPDDLRPPEAVWIG